MPRFVAQVPRTPQPQPGPGEPQAERVEIEMSGGPEAPCFLFRFTRDGVLCGDTWHETLEGAFAQAAFEFDLGEEDFSPARD